MSYDFDAIDEAGLKQGEFAALLPAARITVNNWINGRSSPHTMLEKRVRAWLKLLRVAVKLELLPGELPPAHKDSMVDRKTYIDAALDKAKAAVRKTDAAA